MHSQHPSLIPHNLHPHKSTRKPSMYFYNWGPEWWIWRFQIIYALAVHWLKKKKKKILCHLPVSELLYLILPLSYISAHLTLCQQLIHPRPPSLVSCATHSQSCMGMLHGDVTSLHGAKVTGLKAQGLRWIFIHTTKKLQALFWKSDFLFSAVWSIQRHDFPNATSSSLLLQPE